MVLGFKAQEITVRDLFLESETLNMPPYQRGYSWTEKEALDLVEDLLEAFQRNRSYFLGAIVLVQHTPREPIEVVDGQQRLATLSMLFAILRDLTRHKDEANRYHELIEKPALLPSGRQWRLTLNNVDTPIFRETVQKRGATNNIDTYLEASETSQHILNNLQAMRDYLKDMPQDERSAFANYVKRSCGLVRVKVEDRDMGYSVFRVLNTRGKQPSANDILKSELFELAGFTVDEAAIHSIAWNKFGRRLHSSGFDELLKVIWTLHGKPGDDILSGYREHIIRKVGARFFLEDELPRFVDAYELIKGIRSPGAEFPSEAWDFMLFMRNLEHSGWRIPVLKYMMSGDHSQDALVEFFKHMERLAYAMQLVRTDGNFRNRRYNRLAKAIDEKEDLFTPDSPLSLTPDEAKNLKERLEGRFATYRQRRALSLRVNALVEGGSAIAYDSDATLEHILPRNPGPNSPWLAEWPSVNVQREHVDCLGNFTLLNNAENQEADRKDFKTKKEIFFRNGSPSFALSRDLNDYDVWTPAIVKARSKRLADLLRDAWEL